MRKRKRSESQAKHDRENKKKRRKEEKGRKRLLALDYVARNARLKALGFDSYEAYLESSLWKGIRKRVLARDKRRCRICNRPASSVHHTRYSMEALKGQQLDVLVTICHSCHYQIEFSASGAKRHPLEVDDQWKRRSRKLKDLLRHGLDLREREPDPDDMTAEFLRITRNPS